jgi:hypothetical protein
MRLCLFVFSICLCLILGAGQVPAKAKMGIRDIRAVPAAGVLETTAGNER